MEEAKIIEKIKEIKSMPAREKFLANLRLELISYISAHPVKNERPDNIWSMFRLKAPFGERLAAGRFGILQKAAAVFLIIAITGTAGAAIASQTSLPGHKLYPVKILTEDLRSSLAASPEIKAKLEAEFAAKRVGEVKIMLEKNNPEPQMLEVALNRLQLNASNAVNIINAENQKGKDVSSLAKDITDNFGKNQEVLDDILKEQKNNIKKQKQEIKIQITAVRESGNAAQEKILSQQLEELANRKKITEINLYANKELMETKLADIEKHMKEEERIVKAQKEARKTIIEAEKESRELTNSLTLEKAASIADMMRQFNAVLAKAQEAFDGGKYAEAEKMAKETRSIIKEAEKLIEATEDGLKEDKARQIQIRENKNAGKERREATLSPTPTPAASPIPTPPPKQIPEEEDDD